MDKDTERQSSGLNRRGFLKFAALATLSPLVNQACQSMEAPADSTLASPDALTRFVNPEEIKYTRLDANLYSPQLKPLGKVLELPPGILEKDVLSSFFVMVDLTENQARALNVNCGPGKLVLLQSSLSGELIPPMGLNEEMLTEQLALAENRGIQTIKLKDQEVLQTIFQSDRNAGYSLKSGQLDHGFKIDIDGSRVKIGPGGITDANLRVVQIRADGTTLGSWDAGTLFAEVTLPDNPQPYYTVITKGNLPEEALLEHATLRMHNLEPIGNNFAQVLERTFSQQIANGLDVRVEEGVITPLLYIEREGSGRALGVLRNNGQTLGPVVMINSSHTPESTWYHGFMPGEQLSQYTGIRNRSSWDYGRNSIDQNIIKALSRNEQLTVRVRSENGIWNQISGEDWLNSPMDKYYQTWAKQGIDIPPEQAGLIARSSRLANLLKGTEGILGAFAFFAQFGRAITDYLKLGHPLSESVRESLTASTVTEEFYLEDAQSQAVDLKEFWNKGTEFRPGIVSKIFSVRTDEGWCPYYISPDKIDENSYGVSILPLDPDTEWTETTPNNPSKVEWKATKGIVSAESAYTIAPFEWEGDLPQENQVVIEIEKYIDKLADRLPWPTFRIRNIEHVKDMQGAKGIRISEVYCVVLTNGVDSRAYFYVHRSGGAIA